MRRGLALGIWLGCAAIGVISVQAAETIVVGSKNFTESYVLAELMAQLIEAETDLTVERRVGLGGTKICFESLQKGEIDLYPEYSGTGTLVILKDPSVPSDDLAAIDRRFSDRYKLNWLAGFGFNNSWALVVRAVDAQTKRLQTYSDLAGHSSMRAAFSYEFLNRSDGWPGLVQTYGLGFGSVTGIQHDLAYEALARKQIDLTDAYTTDGELRENDLVVLSDDREFFPKYLAAPLVRTEILVRYPEIKKALTKVSGRIGDRTMQKLNLDASKAGDAYPEVVQRFLRTLEVKATPPSTGRAMLRRTLRHLLLTGLSVLLAALVAIPVGICMRNSRRSASLVLGVTGILQTIPSIAMLGFMLPLFGIGVVPAIVALFLYGLLPIVRNTYVGLREVPKTYLEVARGQGLTRFEILWHLELPLATRVILAGIRTSAVINVGTATLAAFIGAGGLGEPIVTGIALHDTGLILEGAIPAALLALVVDGVFAGYERYLLPRGIRVAATQR